MECPNTVYNSCYCIRKILRGFIYGGYWEADFAQPKHCISHFVYVGRALAPLLADCHLNKLKQTPLICSTDTRGSCEQWDEGDIEDGDVYDILTRTQRGKDKRERDKRRMGAKERNEVDMKMARTGEGERENERERQREKKCCFEVSRRLRYRSNGRFNSS